MNTRIMTALALLGLVAVGCGKAEVLPLASVDAATAINEAPAVAAAAVDAATEAPARALGLKLGFAYTANLMGELEPCG